MNRISKTKMIVCITWIYKNVNKKVVWSLFSNWRLWTVPDSRAYPTGIPKARCLYTTQQASVGTCPLSWLLKREYKFQPNAVFLHKGFFPPNQIALLLYMACFYDFTAQWFPLDIATVTSFLYISLSLCYHTLIHTKQSADALTWVFCFILLPPHIHKILIRSSTSTTCLIDLGANAIDYRLSFH